MSKLKNVIAFHALLMSMLFFITEIQAQVQTPRYLSMIVNSNAFYEYLPQGYHTESQTYPLLIFVHGIGELGRGTTISLPAVLYNGPPKVIKEGRFPNSFNINGEVFKFIVISPQFISWPTPTDIEEVIDYAIGNYKVDVNRIYLTGLSMGGGVVWEYASKSAAYANRVAGIVPVCGVAPSNEQKGQIIASANLPVWATHNDGDGTVEVSNTLNFIHYINSSTPPPDPLAKKTIFHDDSHDAWSTTYNPAFKENGLNVFEWMLQYKRSGNNQPPNQVPSANAGQDITITLPVNNVALNGSGTDVDGSIVKYSWTKISGPSQFTISNTSVANPLVNNLIEGEYTFRLTVTDNDDASNSDDVIVKVNASPSITSTSVPGVIQAEDYMAMNGVLTENTNDAGGGKNVGWIHTGDWMDYAVNVAYGGIHTVSFRVATPYTTQRFQLRKSNGTVLATINVPRTGGNQNWATVSTSVTLDAGEQILRIHSLQSGWNINWTEFVIVSPPAPIPGKVEVVKYSAMAGVQIENSKDEEGGWNIGWIDNGDWIDYTINAARAGTYKVNVRVATPYIGAKFQLKNSNGVVLASINVPQTGGYQIWTTASTTVSLPGGNQTIRIYSVEGGWNIKGIEFIDESLLSSLSVYQNVLTSTEKLIPDNPSFGIFPNPASDNVVLRIDNKHTGSLNVLIMDQSGAVRKMFRFTKNRPISQINLHLNELPDGEYLIRIQMKEWSDVRKLIKF